MALKWPGMCYIPIAGIPSPLPRPDPYMKWYGNTFTWFWDGHIKASYYSTSDYREMYDWMVENVEENPKIINLAYGKRPGDQIRIYEKSQIQAGRLSIHFRNKEDAMAFKLRWT